MCAVLTVKYRQSTEMCNVHFANFVFIKGGCKRILVYMQHCFRGLVHTEIFVEHEHFPFLSLA